MKLTKVQITNYRGIIDSTEFDIGDVACLVGRNESGKTNVLKCLQHFNPVDPSVKKAFSADLDWPRNSGRDANDQDVILTTTWDLSEDDVSAIENELGKGALKSKQIKINSKFDGGRTWDISLNEKNVKAHLGSLFGLDADQESKIKDVPISSLAETIGTKYSDDEKLKSVAIHLKKYRESKPVLRMIDILDGRLPAVLYFESYDRMGGKISVDRVTARLAKQEPLERGEELFLSFLDFADVKIEDIKNSATTESYYSKLERAQNRITSQFFSFWKQNLPDQLEIRFGIEAARPQDPPPWNSGNIFHTRIYNRLHKVTVPFDERSAGFTWFFSFLVLFRQIKKKYPDLLILLDEPGLSLHGLAQGDLLRFIDTELKPHHQVIYTTHSPFMVPPNSLDRVRAVEDRVTKLSDGGLVSEGTKVTIDILKVTPETRFPLHALLGYEITQTLFVGPNVLLVEGPGDVLYLQIFSNELRRLGRTGVDDRWTPCPTGGIDKVSAFMSLFAGNLMKIAIFTDFYKGVGGNKSAVEQLRKSEILESSHIFTALDFTGLDESDIEDVIGEDAYIAIVNEAYNLGGRLTLAAANAVLNSPRILKRVEAWFNTQPASVPDFSHYQPAYWLLTHPDFITNHQSLFSGALNRFENFSMKLNPLL